VTSNEIICQLRAHFLPFSYFWLNVIILNFTYLTLPKFIFSHFSKSSISFFFFWAWFIYRFDFASEVQLKGTKCTMLRLEKINSYNKFVPESIGKFEKVTTKFRYTTLFVRSSTSFTRRDVWSTADQRSLVRARGIIFRRIHVRALSRSVDSSAGFTRRRLRVAPDFTCIRTHDEIPGVFSSYGLLHFEATYLSEEDLFEIKLSVKYFLFLVFIKVNHLRSVFLDSRKYSIFIFFVQVGISHQLLMAW